MNEVFPEIKIWRPVEFGKRQVERLMTLGGAVIHLLAHGRDDWMDTEAPLDEPLDPTEGLGDGIR